MLLQRIVLRDVRNFEHGELAFGPRFTVLFGHNGAGKTNVLEAIYLVATLRSFRTAELGPLVRHGCTGAAVELTIHDPAVDLERELAVRLARSGTSVRRMASEGGKLVRAAADFYGRVRAVLFTPEDLGVLRGSPQARRQFLDRMLFARDRTHIGDVQSYEKLLRSRNHVLKHGEPSRQQDDMLATYEDGLARYGARIWSRRTQLLEALALPFTAAFASIHGVAGPRPHAGTAATATARYHGKLGDVPELEREAVLRDALAARRRDDGLRGTTTVGPHRDDFTVELEGRSAGEFASQGQARALVLALKLAELRAAAALGPAPVLLLDDVSSELDPGRSALLFELLTAESGQCVLTTTDARHVTLPSTTLARWWRVETGRLEPVSNV